MCDIYTQSKEDPSNKLSALGLGGLCVLAAFALLPILTQIPNFFITRQNNEIQVINDPLPDFIFPDEISIITPPEVIVIKDLEIPPPPVSINELERLMNPGDGGVTVASGWGTQFTKEDTNIDIFLPSQLEEQPHVLVAANPLYPYDMKGVGGEVVVEFVIDATGRVKRPRVVESTHRAFEQPALDAILKSKWQPGKKEKVAVQTLVRLAVNFKK